jgi:hypothetical protein
MVELENKTGWEILNEVDGDLSYRHNGTFSKTGLSSKRWVSLESHEKAMKEREDAMKLAIENSLRIGRENAEERFKALLAEQRKRLLESEPSGYTRGACADLLSVLEERLK